VGQQEGEAMAKKLSNFLIELSSNPAQVEAFRTHPHEFLDQSGLSDEDRRLIESREIQGIQEKIARQEGLSSADGRAAISIILPRIGEVSSANSHVATSIVLPSPPD
jgi:hypothetical protein